MHVRTPSAPAAPASPGVFVESLEGRQMLAAHIVGSPVNYATIQAAVNAARPGATIKVDAGVYQELVTVNKTLTIKGARAGVDARSSRRGPASGESTLRGEDFGGGNRSTSFYVTASNVTIDGFTVKDDFSSNVYGAGIVLGPGISGTDIVNNIVRDNVAGLYLANASTANPAVIRNNLFVTNNNPGNNNGRAIYSDGGVSGGRLAGVLIDANTFVNNFGDGTSGNPEAAIGLEAQTSVSQSNIAITNNVMTGNGKGILVYNTTNLLIANNVFTASTDATSAAIRIEGGVSDTLILANTIRNNAGAAIRITDRFGANSSITVLLNGIFNNAGGGIIIDPEGYVGTLNARFNWWGSAAGPGAANTGPVDATPWLFRPAGAIQWPF